MKKQIKRNLSRVLALFVAFVMFTTQAFAAITVENQATCGKPSHQHTDACYETVTEEAEKVLDCKDPTHHMHSDACYEVEWKLTCQEDVSPEVHTHTDECYKLGNAYICGETEHIHTDACYPADPPSQGESAPAEGAPAEDGQATDVGNTDKAPTCGQTEHTHSDACKVKELHCTQSDAPKHTHTERCYDGTNKVLKCKLPEVPHTDACYKAPESANPVTKKVLKCKLEEHTHTADCYPKEIGTDLIEELRTALTQAIGSDDKEVILILNGGTLTYSKQNTTPEGANNKPQGNAIVVADGQVLTIADGTYVAGGTIQGDGGSVRLIKVTNGTVNLTGSTTLTNGRGTGGGAIIAMGDNATVNIHDNATITGNTTTANGGAILVENGATLNMYGGTISNNNAVSGGGIYVDGGTFNMNGGTISGNKANIDSYADDKITPKGQGGGIAVKNDGNLTLKGGTISGNEAGEGGGVFIGNDKVGDSYVQSELEMTGGTVDGNIAHLGEGGGIYIQGKGEISGGKITNNKTYTYEDLGGGGIYIESDGELKLTNAVITNNVANGLGGGLAACVHGKNIVYAKDGAAIFGNTALGKGHVTGHPSKWSNGEYNGDLIDGYVLWAGNEIFKNAAQDVFAAGDALKANAQGVSGLITSDTMLGGGDAEWNGYTYCYAMTTVEDEDDNPVSVLARDENGNYILELTKVTKDNDDVVFGNRMVFLTADASPEAIQNAVKAMDAALNGGVLISGNISANTHGGGVANNGVLTIGTEGDFTNGAKQPEIDANKTLTNSANEEENKSLEGGEFTFDLYQVTTDAEGKKTVNKIEGASVKNEEGGNVPNFTFPAEIFKEPGTYTFQVKEDLTGDGGKLEDGSTLKYDKSVYEITIRVTDSKETIKIGDKTVEVVTLTVGEPVIKKIVDVDGNEIENPEELKEGEGIAFGNTYTPKPPEKPKDPEDPPKDPEDPPKDPEDPPKDPEDPPKDPEDPPEDPEDPPEVPEDPEYPPYTPEEPPYSPEYPPYTPEEPVTPPAAPVTPPTIDVPTPPVPQAELPEVPEEPEEPMEEVEEPEVPLVEEPEEEEEEEPEEEEFVEIEDPDVPLASVPMTGDNSYIWTIMTLVSGLALVCLALIKKREDKAE